MEFLPIIIVSSIGLSLCISYLLYHAVDFFRRSIFSANAASRRR